MQQNINIFGNILFVCTEVFFFISTLDTWRGKINSGNSVGTSSIDLSCKHKVTLHKFLDNLKKKYRRNYGIIIYCSNC